MKKFNLLYDSTIAMTKIGRYRILHELGAGAMGLVYRGVDTIIDRVVAIKTIKMGKAITNVNLKDMLTLFYQEVRIAGKLSHPNIATIFDVGEFNDIHYFVMEYVDGVNLKSIIMEKASFRLIEKVGLLIQIANALHYAHQRGVIHRDIKPANIMIVSDDKRAVRDYQVKIMDFGIAMLSSSNTGIGKQSSERILGTPSYMSPEQISGLELDRQTDIFSLACLAYEFLAGKKPFSAPTLPELFQKIKTTTPTQLYKIDPTIPEDLSKCILKGLEKNKEYRYQSAGEFADELEIFHNREELLETQKLDISKEYADKEFLQSLKRNYAFFSDFSIDELNTIYNISLKLSYKKGDVIFKENTVGSKMFIIISGQVKITKQFDDSGTETILNVLKLGECFGEMSIISAAPRFAAAVAETDCSLIAINEVILRTSEPRLCLKLYKNLAIILTEKLKKSDAKVNALLARMKN
ncbi:serine/threonine-protein kinase [Candidatus Magnetomonas plexicatena]|uniref:serine/threonine-protein kinase n=1 Tax=Candidatus Magnetomonas plexicatena TaxID=2552947 RepID=UPI001C76523E|nr:protein kinase [Nitrospirales bacterium LBB_01]